MYKPLWHMRTHPRAMQDESPTPLRAGISRRMAGGMQSEDNLLNTKLGVCYSSSSPTLSVTPSLLPCIPIVRLVDSGKIQCMTSSWRGKRVYEPGRLHRESRIKDRWALGQEKLGCYPPQQPMLNSNTLPCGSSNMYRSLRSSRNSICLVFINVEVRSEGVNGDLNNHGVRTGKTLRSAILPSHANVINTPSAASTASSFIILPYVLLAWYWRLLRNI